MSIDSAADFDGITRAGKVVAEALNAMVQARSAPQVVYGCPAANLISVNDEIVHGLPSGRVLRAGDVVKIDVTAEIGGYVADAATTVVLPDASVEALGLRDCAISAFTAGLTAARAGRLVAEIGRAVEREVSARGFHVLRELSGHGVGRTIHESPTVLNYFDPAQQDVLTEGLVLTIEPLISQRRTRAVDGEDGWTLRTRNGCLAAHHEHTIIITNADPLIVTQL